MAKLYFRYGAMGSSKTANAIMVHYNYDEMGQKALMIKSLVEQRDGKGLVKSRSGMTCECIYMEQLTDEMAAEYDCLIVDEAQFLSPEQVKQLVHVVDELGIPVIAYGLRADFRGDLFPGSACLLAWADTIEEVKTVCWCGKKATCNTRVINGKVVKEGEQVFLGGNDSYVSLCRKHWAEGNLGDRQMKNDHLFTEARVREAIGPDEKRKHWDLLLLADPEEDAVLKYLDRGRMFVVESKGQVVAEAVVAERDDGQLELKNLATNPTHQHQGHATQLIEYISTAFKGKYSKLYVGTAFEGLYEHWGFEKAYTLKNFFIDNYKELIFDEGRQCIDMVYFAIEL